MIVAAIVALSIVVQFSFAATFADQVLDVIGAALVDPSILPSTIDCGTTPDTSQPLFPANAGSISSYKCDGDGKLVKCVVERRLFFLFWISTSKIVPESRLKAMFRSNPTPH